MEFLYKLVVNFTPKAFSVGLWVNYILNQTLLWLSLAVTAYSILLYLVVNLNPDRKVDGFIEVSEKEEGNQTWSLVLDRDPSTLQNKDTIIFQVKKAVQKSYVNHGL